MVLHLSEFCRVLRQATSCLSSLLWSPPYLVRILPLKLRYPHSPCCPGGSVTLASSDPFADPLINPGYLTSEFDILAMVQALKDAQYFIQASPWADFVVSPFGDLANATTDDDLALYARNFSVTVNHSIGTARMSPVGANWGVVDPDLVLKGVKGVRVVDASVFVSYLCPLHLFCVS